MRLLYFLTVFILLGCANKKNTKNVAESNLSKTEVGLKKILDSFKLDYKKATTNSLDSTIDKYNVKVFNYLSNESIDSISVHVDTIIVNGLTITTKFHNKDNVSFQYGLTFEKPMTEYYDSLFNFMSGLKMGTDTTINFSYMDSHQLNNPNDKLLPTLKVFAIPSFLRTKE